MTTSTRWQLARDSAERYERILVPAILGPAARALVEWSSLRAGETVLDVGCGTGAAARFAAEKVGPSGRVAGIDVNSGMIDVARCLPSVDGCLIEWFENSAYQVQFAESEFDVALCAQTLQFLEDPPRALKDMYRILKPGGRTVVSLWCDICESPYFHELVLAVTKHIGTATAAGLRAAFSLSNSETIRDLLSGAGFKDTKATVEQLDIDLQKPRDFVPRHVSATPMAAGFQAATEDARQAVIHDVSERLAPYETDQGIRVPFCMHLMVGIRG